MIEDYDNNCGFNFANKQGKLISDKWFLHAWDFKKSGIAEIYIGDTYHRKHCYIDTKGKIYDEKQYKIYMKEKLCSLINKA